MLTGGYLKLKGMVCWSVSSCMFQMNMLLAKLLAPTRIPWLVMNTKNSIGCWKELLRSNSTPLFPSLFADYILAVPSIVPVATKSWTRSYVSEFVQLTGTPMCCISTTETNLNLSSVGDSSNSWALLTSSLLIPKKFLSPEKAIII